MKTNFNINNLPSLAVLIIYLAILIVIPVYWFFIVPSALELQEIYQDSFNASGYFAPGAYFNLTIDMDAESTKIA